MTDQRQEAVDSVVRALTLGALDMAEYTLTHLGEQDEDDPVDPTWEAVHGEFTFDVPAGTSDDEVLDIVGGAASVAVTNVAVAAALWALEESGDDGMDRLLHYLRETLLSDD